MQDKIDELLTRGVAEILPTKEDLKSLITKQKITLYQGFDPTGTKLHIGHAVALRKLRQFQDLGHNVIFLIGDGTGQAGDPSGKKSAREKFFNREELRENAKDYVKQAGKIVRFDGPNPVQILYNSDWLNKLKLVDILDIAQNFSVQQLIERDMYQERIKKGESINLREFLYPLLQGYDSVAMKVDLELGGTDQTFNMLAGRSLVKSFLGKEKYVMSVPLLTDSKGTKIGKSEGNVIGLTDAPIEFYAKIMSLSDDSIVPCLELLTDIPMSEIEDIKNKIKTGDNPLDFKKKLAFVLTEQFNSTSEAKLAEEAFKKTFQDQSPDFVDFKISSSLTLTELIAGIVGSNTEAKRKIKEGAVDVDSVCIKDPNFEITGNENVKIGKKTFLHITK